MSSSLRHLVSATAISSLGDGLVVVAFPLLALHFTTNPLLISVLAASSRLPWLLVGLVSGALVDRTNRRRLVGIVELTRAVIVGLVAVGALIGGLSLSLLYLAAFLIGAGETFVVAASRAVVPQLVSSDDLVRVNGILGAAETANEEFAGPGLGGFAYAAARALPFFADALSYVGSAILLRAAMRKHGEPIERRESTIGADIKSGLASFAQIPQLRILAGAVSSFALCQAMALGVLVLYATRMLHLGSVGYGVLLMLAAVGDVAGNLVARRIHVRLGAWLTLLLAGAVASAGYLVLGTTSMRVVAVVALAFEAGASSLGNVATLTARYRLIPPERFGVINNTYRMFVVGSIPVGALIGGALASSLGIPAAFLTAGALQFASLLLLALPLRRVASL